MPDFRIRSNQTEMIDGVVPRDQLFQNLHELEFLNRNFGGHRTSLTGMRDLINNKNRTYHIFDFGCGGGDTMIQIAEWGRKMNFKLKLTGIDKNRDIIDYARHRCSRFPEISAVTADYRRFIKSNSTADIMHCSLFCHHLSDEQFEELLIYFNNSARVGFVINDLVRSRVAYYLVRMLTGIANASVVSRNDGPVSVLRGFNINDLKMFLKKASISNFTISFKWAFRVLITGYAGGNNTGIDYRSGTGRTDDGLSAD